MSIATETRDISAGEEEGQEEAAKSVGEGGEAGCNDFNEGRQVSRRFSNKMQSVNVHRVLLALLIITAVITSIAGKLQPGEYADECDIERSGNDVTIKFAE